MNIATAFVEVRVDRKKAEDDAESAAKGALKKMTDVFKAGVFIAGLKKSIDDASNLNETISKTGVIFDSGKKAIEDFASTAAQKLGLSKQSAMDAASTFATFGKSAGMAGEDLVGFSTKLVGLSSDLASFYNTSPEDAIYAIGAALRGESEPIRRYGVLLNDATLKQTAMEMGLYSGTGALSMQAKVLASQQEILNQTSDAQGDFARTADGLANSQRIAAAEAQNASASFGQVLLPVYERLVKMLSAVIGAFADMPAPVQTAIVAMVGFMAFSGPIGSLKDAVVDASAALVKMGLSLGKQSAYLAAGLAVVAAAVGLYMTYTKGKREAEAATKEFSEALKAEAEGQENATSALIARKIAESNALDVRKQLGVTDADIAAAIRGETVPAIEAVIEAYRKATYGGKSWDQADRELREQFGLTAGQVNRFTNEVKLLAAGMESGLEVEKERAETARALAAAEKYGSDITDRKANATYGSAKASADAAQTAEQLAAADQALAAAMEELKESTERIRYGFDEASDAADTLRAAIDRVFGGAMDLEEAERAVRDATDDVTEALKENGNTLDINTEKGRANREAVQGQVESILDYGASLIGAGKSADEAEAAIGFLTEGLKNQLRQAGLTEEQINDYLETLGLTPENVTTTIAVAEDDIARGKLEGLIEQLGEVDAGAAAEITALIDQGRYDEAEAKIREIARDRNIQLKASVSGGGTIEVRPTGTGAGGFYVRAYAQGGVVDEAMFLAGEAGREAVLPLTKPNRLRQVLEDPRVSGPVSAALGTESSTAATKQGAQVSVTFGDIVNTVDYDAAWRSAAFYLAAAGVG